MNSNATRRRPVLPPTLLALGTLLVSACVSAIAISIGLTTLLASDESFAALYSRADRSLYLAKQSGRNRTCSTS